MLSTEQAHIENDGYAISKKRRVERTGSQLDQVLSIFKQFRQRGRVDMIPGLVCSVGRDKISGGGEIIAHKWLPSPNFDVAEHVEYGREQLRSMSLAVANNPEIIEELLDDFEQTLASGPVDGRPSNRTTLSKWFTIIGGKTTQAKTHPGGETPYISSGDQFNSIDDFLSPPEEEIFAEPCITVTGFGQAYIQPWRCCVRGGAGSAPHVLIPRYAMSLSEMIWFVGQINAQKWRFYYGRMASKTRLHALEVDPPASELPVSTGLIQRLKGFQINLDDLYKPAGDDDITQQFEVLASLWKHGREPHFSTSMMAKHPAHRQIVSMGEKAIPLILKELRQHPEHWFMALQQITGENPVSDTHSGDVRKMAQDWIKWGTNRGYTDNGSKVTVS